MAELTDSELAGIVYQEIALAEGFDADQLTENRKQALDYFFGKPRGDEVTGCSDVVSLDVSDMIEAILANMMPAFAGDTLVMFEPDNDGDVKQAQLESDITNNIIMERNRGYWILSESIKDALLLRNGICKAQVEITEEVIHRELTAVDEISVALAIADAEPNEQRALISATEVATEIGDNLVDAVIKITTETAKLVVTSVDPTTFLTNENTTSIFLDDIRFMAERSYPTRTELIEGGFDKKVVNDLPVTTQNTKTDTRARDRKEDVERKGSQIDKSEETVEQYEVYMRVDRDKDGISELHKIIAVSRIILLDEVVDFHPYATGTAFVNPHKYNSISLFDKLKPIQDIKTKGIRQWIDNIEANNNVTTVVTDAANLDDASESRPGKVIRSLHLDAVKELPIQNLGASSAALLEYTDKMRSERGGASLDLQGAELQIAGDTAHGIERQFSSREQLAALMTRNISETLIRSLYLLVHRTLRLHMPGEIVSRIGGEFTTSDPGQWPERERVNVKTGLSIGERINKKNTLEQIIAKQTELFAGGMDGVLVNLQGYHNALTDWGKAANIDNPDRYFSDPASQASQEAQQGKQQARQDQTQREEQLNQMIFGVQNQLEQARVQLEGMGQLMDKREADNELRFKYFEANLKAETEEAKIVGNATLELEKQQEQGDREASQLKAVET